MPKYRVLSPLKHDDKIFEADEVVELTKDQAKSLEGTIEPAQSSRAKAAGKTVPPAPTEKDETPADEPEADAGEEEGEGEGSEGPSKDWSRSELNEHAEALGIEDPASLPNKQAVLEAIEEADAGEEEGEGE